MFVRALVESAERFVDLPPIGYEELDIRWVLEIDSSAEHLDRLVRFDKGALVKEVPTRGDRSGTVSATNLKPALFVDRASYALGLKDMGEIDTETLEHKGFLELLKRASVGARDQESGDVVRFLEDRWPLKPSKSESEGLARLRACVRREVKPKDLIALRSGGRVFPFETAASRSFWVHYLEQTCCEATGVCSICGEERSIVRVLPWQIALFGYSCPISSFNNNAFDSFGKEQTANSPMCFYCASRASQVLQHLVQPGRHSSVLAKDESKGEGKSPLRNVLAVFWVKDDGHRSANVGGRKIVLEDFVRKPLESGAALAPPPEVGHMRSLLNVPWSPGQGAFRLDDSRFYLAVLSPNKSRLVVREWMEESVGTVVEKMSAFVEAASLVNSAGTEIVFPTIPRILGSLKPAGVRNAGIDTNLARGVLRTAYRGLPPPPGLLDLAVQRYRIPDRAGDGKEEEEMEARRTVLIATMKLVITYGRQEAISLQKLSTSGANKAYLSGQLLAILEEAQMRASGWKVNSTLVDRFYGAASTAPGSVLGRLVGQSTTSHMPKIRKEGRGYGALEELLENALGKLDECGGFPNTLPLREQADFALGFYHQRANFRASRTRPKGTEPQEIGEQPK